jgi:hypothetical protein
MFARLAERVLKFSKSPLQVGLKFSKLSCQVKRGGVVAQTVDGTQGELERSHAAAVRVVSIVFMCTLGLAALALVVAPRVSFNSSPMVANSLLFVILFFGLGAVVFRRTRFAAMRLQDIAALRGVSGLLETLRQTTIYVALIGGVIAVLGFIFALMTGDGTNMLYPGVIAVAVLLYCYPRRAAWQSVVRTLVQGDSDPVRAAKGTIA